MKKLLSLIGALTIVSGASVQVIACESSPNASDQDKVDKIKKKITKTASTIPSAATKTVAANTKAIKTALKADNPNLTDDDLAKITFAPKIPDASFVPGTALPITATITVDTAKTTVALQVTMKKSDQEKADAIKNKIKTTAFTIDYNKTSRIVAANTVAIKKTLQTNNTALTADDLTKITFTASGSFVPGTVLPITAVITVRTATATATLQVTMLTNDQQKANDIATKITKTALTIPYNSSSQTVTDNTAAIKTALGEANPKLDASDLAKIEFSTGSFSLGIASPVTATITVGVATAHVKLQVTMKRTAQQQADYIKAKIINADLAIPPTPKKTVADNKTAIINALKAVNPLTDDDIATMKFSVGTFIPGTALAVIVTITVDKATATKILQVTMAQSDQEQADAIKDKITNTTLTIPNNTKSQTVAANTIAIKTALKSQNPRLTDDDIATMMFAPKTSGAEFTPGTALDVTATITVGTANATKTLQVTMASTDPQKADAIEQKITDPILTVPLETNSSTANPGTITAIKTALKGDNPTLTDGAAGDLAKIAFNTVTLTADSAVNVTATIKVDTATVTKTLNVTRTVSWIQSTSIPSDAYVQAAPVKIGDTYYLGTVGKGLYTSTDGTTWTQSTSIPTNAYVKAAPVKIDSTYYLSTVGDYGIGGGLYTSTDGTTWTQSASIPTDGNFSSAPVKIGNMYYLSSEGKGLYTSADGIKWTQSTSIPTGAQIYAAPVKIDNTYYLGTDNGLYTSTDGTAWTQSTSIPTDASVLFAPVKIDNTYYLGSVGKGLYTSTDGTTWTQLSGFPTDAFVPTAPVKIGDTYYLGTFGKGLYTSTDGTTWNQSKSIPSSAGIYSAPVKINNIYYLSTYGKGLYTSTNGTTWTQSKIIPSNAYIYFAPVKIGNTYYLSIYGKGLYFGT